MKTLWIWLVVAAAACGGPTAKSPGAVIGANHLGTDLTSVPPRMTKGVLAGPLCGEQECTCRDETAADDGGAGLPTDDRKRFELRIGPAANELWVSVGEHLYYKSAERASACFYFDLATGEIPVALRASNNGGVSAAVAISEYGTATKSWYQTFQFKCGSPGICSYDELDSNKTEYKKFAKGLHDPCGSVRIQRLNWNSSEAADQQHPSELAVTLGVNVYKFAPSKPHGSECATGGN